MPRAAAFSRATRIGAWLLAFVLPASAFALGSLPVEVLMAMSGLAALACALLWVDPSACASRASHGVLVALAVLVGMSVLQAIPLPSALTHALSPASADIWQRALAPLREEGPSFHPLSVAPVATRVEVLRGCFYGCVFLGALRVATLENGERFLLRVIVGSTSAMAFSALAHTAVTAEKVFGVYRPLETSSFARGRLSPLLNTNHLAAYLGIGACVSLGALLSKRTMPRALSASTFLVLAATSLWQGSRGATGALLFGVVLTFALTFYAKRRSDDARASVAILAACAVAATILVTLSLSASSEHLLSHDFSKIDVARRALGLVSSSPWFGFGRGGFESVFSSVREGTTYWTWTNPEDLVVQWLVEWGVPVTIVGLALLGWAMRPQILLRAIRPAIGAWVAVIATALHELVDYHLEVPGITALVAVCVAVVVSGRPSSRESGRPAAASSPRIAALALSVGALAAIAFAVPGLGHSLAQDRRDLSAKAIDTSLSHELFRHDVRAAMLRYPAEPFFPLMGAVRAQVNDEGSALPWAARALERNPRFGRAHFVLARSLARGHASQARLEYRLAYENDESLRVAVVKEALPIIDDMSEALELVPEGPAGAEIMDALVVGLAPRLPSTAVMLDAELERRAPLATRPLLRRTEAVVADAADGAPWCAASARDCVLTALAAAEELARRVPGACSSHVLVARMRIAKGEAAAGLDDLERASDHVSDRALCRRQLVNLALANGETRRGDLFLERLVRGGCGGAAECLDFYGWAAATEEERGHYASAVHLYRRILELDPERDDLLQRIGELGDRDGLVSEALDAYRTLAIRHPTDPRWPARSAELRARIGVRPTVPLP